MIVDAQSVKTTDLTKNSGYDGGKKISGIKRHMAVDINGLPQAILVTRANVSDRSGALAMFSFGLKSIFETDFKRHSEPRLPSTAQINH